MLLLLHGALLLGWNNVLSRGLLVSHLGLFLLWQPIWRGEKKLTPASGLMVVSVGLLFLLWINWWLIALWLSLLIGLIGGNVFATQGRASRWFYLTAELYLMGALLVWVVPHLLGQGGVPQAASAIMYFGLPLFIFGMVAIPAREEPQELQSIDFFYSLLLFLLMVVLVLGSFALKVEAHEDYLTALSSALLIAALVLLGLSWFWSPRGGFAGLEQIFSRYLLSIGLPFEQWLHRLAQLSENVADPRDFLKLAMAGLADLPGIIGGEWQSSDGSGRFGETGNSQAHFESPPLFLVLYAKSPLSPALRLHFNLLVQLMGAFYQAKRREQMLEQHAYLQAVHETGARLTHDVRNLLQSLKALCAAADHGQNGEGCSLQSLFARQLPRITQRLEQALDKLRQPAREESFSFVESLDWWEALRQRYADENLQFEQSGNFANLPIPTELFDSVADNLLQNALEKRKLENSLNIGVVLTLTPGVTLRVCDDGRAVDEKLASRLFTAPVASHNGLGIGLYQSGKLAAQQGYELHLTDNETGHVCFELRDRTSPRKELQKPPEPHQA
ncbi:MAG: HAMP domain-containing histidine kinase [Sulfuricella sp.]|nr:HAMP domain-containing histidine kinase [Sulfuricella sp.]